MDLKGAEIYPTTPWKHDPMRTQDVQDYAQMQASKEQLWRREWDDCVGEIDSTYNALVSAGMPAEDARGLLPTNLLTRINYNTSLRGLQEHAGLRLCTQAQFEWRLVWTRMLEAIREYGKDQYYLGGEVHDFSDRNLTADGSYAPCSSAWQFEALAGIFKPICYYRGSCQFNADVDRACKIKSRVEQFASLGIPSTKWTQEDISEDDVVKWPGIENTGTIRDSEWMLDPSAARVSQ